MSGRRKGQEVLTRRGVEIVPPGERFCPRINDWGGLSRENEDSDLFRTPRFPTETNSARVSPSPFIVWVYGYIFPDCCLEGGGVRI